MTEKMTVRLRALGTELSRARARSEMTLQDVSQRLDISMASLSRIENGIRAPRVATVAGMLVAYNITGDERRRLMGMTEDLDRYSWFQTRSSGVDFMPTTFDFEDKATSIIEFGSRNIPGLLQTESYARAIIKLGNHTPSRAEELVVERLKRQDVLAKIVPPNIVAYIDEAALRGGYGGKDVMAGQTRRLIELAGRPRISVRVLPFFRGGYSISGVFRIFAFRKSPTIAYTEGCGLAAYIDHPADVEGYLDRAARLDALALGSTESVNFMEIVLADLERG